MEWDEVSRLRQPHVLRGVKGNALDWMGVIEARRNDGDLGFAEG